MSRYASKYENACPFSCKGIKQRQHVFTLCFKGLDSLQTDK